MSQRRAVIIDTDPGLDDAVAILLALASPELDVLGITTVAGNIGLDVVTHNAGRLLAHAGRSDIPVIAGAAAPLKRIGIDEVAIHGDDGLGGVVLPEPGAPAAQDAVGWVATGLAALPAGTVDILALGPLTNIARLIQDHPQAARRIGRIIAMGGAIHDKGNVGPRSEFNFANDPEAVAIVFRSNIRVVLIPLDVTRKVRADGDYLVGLRESGNRNSMVTAGLIEAYFKEGRESRPLHDPCVMVLAVRPDLFGIELLGLSVDLGDGPDAGALNLSGAGAIVDVAMTVDAPGVLAFMKERLRA